ncbi:hypothetical protein K439DRAFT_1615648 [Ramaria rubella]|nr:hypothetical protein K439DRAFT_1615648 [Ramaria rubella]
MYVHSIAVIGRCIKVLMLEYHLADSLGIVRLEIRRVKENMEVECINGNDEVEMEYIDQPPQPPFITFEYHLKLSPSSMDGTTADSEDRDSDDSEKGRRPDEGLKSILRSGKRRRSSKFAEIEPSPSKNRSKPSKCVQNSLDNDMEQQPEMEEIQRTNPPFSERLRPERNAPPPDNDIEAQLLDISKRAMKLRKNNDETEARIREEQLQLEIEEEKVRKLELKALSDQIERRRLALKQRRTVLKRQETSVSTVSGKAKVLRVPRKKVSRGDGFPRPLQMHPNFFAKKSFGTP